MTILSALGLNPDQIRQSADALAQHMQTTAANTGAIAERLAAIDRQQQRAQQQLALALQQLSDLALALDQVNRSVTALIERGESVYGE